jgi:hypothetical protein
LAASGERAEGFERVFLCHRGVLVKGSGQGSPREGIAKSKEGGRGNLIQKCHKNPMIAKV